MRVTLCREYCPDCGDDGIRLVPDGVLAEYSYTPSVELPDAIAQRLLDAQAEHAAAEEALCAVVGAGDDLDLAWDRLVGAAPMPGTVE